MTDGVGGEGMVKIRMIEDRKGEVEGVSRF